MAPDLDCTVLRRAPTREDLERLKQEIAAGELGAATQADYTHNHGILVLALIGGFLGLVFGGMSLVAFIRGSSEDGVLGLVATGVVLVIAAGCGALAAFDERRGLRRTWRLVELARANGLEVQPTAKVTLLPGSIFTTKAHARTTDQVRWTVDGASAETADHHRGGNGTRFTGRYLAVQLGSDVPRLSFLCGARGIARSGLGGAELVVEGPEVPGRRRRPRGTLISSGKTMDRARELLTDEVTALLLDATHACNAETAGGYFFAYYHPARGHWSDETLVRHAHALADAVVRADRSRRARS